MVFESEIAQLNICTTHGLPALLLLAQIQHKTALAITSRNEDCEQVRPGDNEPICKKVQKIHCRTEGRGDGKRTSTPQGVQVVGTSGV